MSKSNFQRFITREDKGAKLKEKIRQEKKQLRKETREYFAQKKRSARSGSFPSSEADEQAAPRPSHSTASAGASGHAHQVKRSRPPAATPRKAAAPPPAKKTTARATPPRTSGPKTTATKIAAAKTIASKTTATKATATKTAAAGPATSGIMPLNKYIAHAGICSRRDAATLVKEGKVSVDGQVITEPGHKVSGKEDIRLQGKKLTAQQHYVYILLNKPKDHITTLDDPEGRKTVMDIVKKATTERVYPVGRLDRNTTGVLLLTNDGALTQKLSHPSYQVKKIYEVTLDRPLSKKDFDELAGGLVLEDGPITPDSVAYADARNKSVIGIEIHSGKNRIVRRMFEKLGYDVRNLDRVMYANLTKKNVERGKWRFLQEKEIRLLKYINASYTRKK